MSTPSETVLLVFVAITGLAVLLQAVVLLAIFLAIRKNAGMLQQQLDILRTSVMPVVTGTHDLLTQVGPHIGSLSKDLAEISKGLRVQSAEFQTLTSDIMARAERQSIRLDAMCTSALDTVGRAGNVLVDTINVPLRQISGMAAFARAALGAFRSAPPRPRPTHAAADKDMFV
ncbi:MAG: hypothetical protein WCA37_12025 [Terracidiphilus sp.]